MEEPWVKPVLYKAIRKETPYSSWAHIMLFPFGAHGYVRLAQWDVPPSKGQLLLALDRVPSQWPSGALVCCFWDGFPFKLNQPKKHARFFPIHWACVAQVKPCQCSVP